MNTEQKAIAIQTIATMSRKNERIDAMRLAGLFNRVNGTHIDFHEFAFLLDELRARGIIRQSNIRGYDGFQVYELNV